MSKGTAGPKGTLYVRHPLSKTESTLLASLAERGHNIFSIDDVTSTLDTSYGNAKVIVNRLVKKAWLIRLTRGTYLIVPLEAGVRSQYTEHGFVIASHLVDPYYIGYWSALNHHGLTEQVPSTIFVVSNKRRRDRVILNTRFRFITVTDSKMFGWVEENISNSSVKISNVNKTIADCLDHPKYCGGIDAVAQAIYFGHAELDIERIIRSAEKMGNKAILKRLGYLLDFLNLHRYDQSFEDLELTQGYSKLDPNGPKKGRYNDKWNLLVNVEITPESWMK